MSLFVLDTDHISLHERGHASLRTRLARLSAAEIAVSVITVEEAIRGRLAVLARHSAGETRIRAYTKFFETVKFMGVVNVLQYDLICERQFQELKAMRLGVGSQDLRIAAIALCNKAILVTRNRRDFERIPDLVVQDWSVEE